MRTAVGTVWTIATNELRRVVTDRTALFFALAMPVIITIIIGSTFGGADVVDVGVLDRDGTDPSRELVATLDDADGVTVETYDSVDDLRRDVRTGSLSAAVVVPGGYSERLDRGEGATVDMISDPTSNSVAAARATVEAAISDEAVLAAAAGFAAEHGGPSVAGDVDAARAAAERVSGELPAIEVRDVAVGGGDEGADVGRFSYTAPSNLVLFVFVNTIAVGSLIATDRKQGIITRLLSTPHGTGTILAGIGAAKLLFALVQSALLVGIGALLFGVSWGDPLAAALLIVVFAAVATAVGLLVGSMASDADQAQSVAIPVAIAMGMLGGCMWPLDIVPAAMRTAGHAVPHAWAMDAWIGLILDGDGVTAILPELAVLTGFAVVLGLIAARRLRSVLTSY
jgi:ABC-2 type transport system permease protein